MYAGAFVPEMVTLFDSTWVLSGCPVWSLNEKASGTRSIVSEKLLV
jgi:hypothetical protein